MQGLAEPLHIAEGLAAPPPVAPGRPAGRPSLQGGLCAGLSPCCQPLTQHHNVAGVPHTVLHAEGRAGCCAALAGARQAGQVVKVPQWALLSCCKNRPCPWFWQVAGRCGAGVPQLRVPATGRLLPRRRRSSYFTRWHLFSVRTSAAGRLVPTFHALDKRDVRAMKAGLKLGTLAISSHWWLPRSPYPLHQPATIQPRLKPKCIHTWIRRSQPWLQAGVLPRRCPPIQRLLGSNTMPLSCCQWPPVLPVAPSPCTI